MAERLGALQQSGADRRQLGRRLLQPRRAKVPRRALVARIERGKFAGVVEHPAVVAIDKAFRRHPFGEQDVVPVELYAGPATLLDYRRRTGRHGRAGRSI